MTASNPSRKPSLRAEQAAATRQRIAGSARLLFARQGYGATTLVQIAAEAGVAVQTVYAVYGSKAAILRGLAESVVRLPEAGELFAATMESTDPGRRLDLFAASIRRRWEWGYDVVRVSQDAATTDAAIRGDVEAVLETRRAGIGRLASSLEGALRPSVSVARAHALLDALSLPDVYAELIEIHGWSPDEFEAWLGETLRAQLLDQTEADRTTRTGQGA